MAAVTSDEIFSGNDWTLVPINSSRTMIVQNLNGGNIRWSFTNTVSKGHILNSGDDVRVEQNIYVRFEEEDSSGSLAVSRL